MSMVFNIREEYRFGKYFNHPPNGMLSSWYGKYEVFVDKPFPVDEQWKSSREVDVYEPSSIYILFQKQM